jgi:hypothetical protein
MNSCSWRWGKLGFVGWLPLPVVGVCSYVCAARFPSILYGVFFYDVVTLVEGGDSRGSPR